MIELDIAGGLATVTLTMPVPKAWELDGGAEVFLAVARAWGLDRSRTVRRPDLSDSPCLSLNVGPSRLAWAGKHTAFESDWEGNMWLDHVEDVLCMIEALCKKRGATYEVVS